MSSPECALDPSLHALRRRNMALAAKLEPVAARLRELLAERAELTRLTDQATLAAQRAAEAAGGKREWVEEGEERFRSSCGAVAAFEAISGLSDLVERLEAGDGHAESPSEPGGWVPSTAELNRLMAEGHDRELRQHADDFRRAIAEAHRAAEGAFLAAPAAYAPGADFEEEARRVFDLLGRALLEVSVAAEEALGRLERVGA